MFRSAILTVGMVSSFWACAERYKVSMKVIDVSVQEKDGKSIGAVTGTLHSNTTSEKGIPGNKPFMDQVDTSKNVMGLEVFRISSACVQLATQALSNPEIYLQIEGEIPAPLYIRESGFVPKVDLGDILPICTITKTPGAFRK